MKYHLIVRLAHKYKTTFEWNPWWSYKPS